MSLVSHWVRIQKSPLEITGTAWEKEFQTPNRVETRPAMLMFMAKGLTSDPVSVKINTVTVGEIQPHAAGKYWFTQIFTFAGNQLDDGDNQISIDNHTGTDLEIQDLVCFFHKQD